GFDATSVADIAERAGLTERTFFRYFVDKREVLFDGATKLEAFLVATIAAAPAKRAPIEVMASALETIAKASDDRPGFAEFARRRQALIARHAELHERELIKLAALAASSARALRDRGIREPTASIVAEAGIATFKVAFERCVADPAHRKLAHHVRE